MGVEAHHHRLDFILDGRKEIEQARCDWRTLIGYGRNDWDIKATWTSAFGVDTTLVVARMYSVR